MEERVLARLLSLFNSGQIDLHGYFKQCAIAGITFAAAWGAIAATPALASLNSQVQAPAGYSAFLPTDIVALTTDADDPPSCSTCTFSKFAKAPDPYSKFVKAPDFIKAPWS